MELKKRKYRLISLEDALTDIVYQQKDNYYKKWGVSWVYRWMATQEERIKNMKKEPSLEEITKLYEEILKKNTKTK